MKFVLKKKKKVLETKTNLHSINQKTLKGKKMKWKEMNKCTYTTKKKSYWEIWDSKLEKRHRRTSTGKRHRSYKQGKMKNVDVKM